MNGKQSIGAQIAQQNAELDGLEALIREQMTASISGGSDPQDTLDTKLAMVSAMRAGLAAGIPLSSHAIQASMADITANAVAHQTKDQKGVNIAATLGEIAAMNELQSNLQEIQEGLLGGKFQTQLKDVLTQAGMTEEYAMLEEQAAKLHSIEQRLAANDLSADGRKSLLHTQYQLLVEYTGDLDALLDHPNVRNIDGAAELAKTMRQAKEDLSKAGMKTEVIEQQMNHSIGFITEEHAQLSPEIIARAAVEDARFEVAQLIVVDVDNTENFSPIEPVLDLASKDTGISF